MHYFSARAPQQNSPQPMMSAQTRLQIWLMMDVSEEGEKPTTLALKRLSEQKVAVRYPSSEGDESGGEQNGAVEEQAEGSAGS